MAELTPMKRQYLAIKDQHPDCLLFFRLGDFYEMFDEDAKTAAAELNLTLTTRDRNKPPEERTPMCGVPYHSAEAYIARLIAKGYKVAICEQTEDPAQAKGLVDREIIRVVTPGTLIEENMLEEGRNNFLASLYVGVQGTGLCFGDISTGEVFLTFFAPEGWVDHAVNELARFAPREVILSPGARDKGLLDHLSGKLPCRVEQAGEERFALAEARQRVERQFAAGLDQVPPEAEAAIQAAGGLLSYLYETQKTDLSYLRTLRYYSTGRFLELDPVARRNLELTETLRGKEKKGSLLWVLDKTKTAMGGRLLRSWLERPLLDPVAISRRLEAVAILPLAHHPDGAQQGPDPGGEHLGKEGAHRQGNYRQHQGDGAQVLLEIHQKSALSLVPVTHIDSANGHITVHNGRGGSGEEGALFIGGVKDIIALEGQYHLLKEGVLVLGGGWLLRRIPVLLLILLGQTVVQQQTGGIGD